MSEFSNSPLGEDPLGFYEGDPYRARAETGPTSGRGHLRDGRFQANGDMAPQMTYINRYAIHLPDLSISNVKERDTISTICSKRRYSIIGLKI